MKKPNLLYLLIIPFLFSSCDDFLAKFDHFGLGDTFEKSFTVSLTNNDPGSFTGTASFDASDDAVLDENIHRISQFEVIRLSLKITSFSGDANAVAIGQISIYSEGLPVGDPVSIDLNLSQAANSGEDIVLPFTDATFEAIKDAYMSNQKIEVTGEGSISDVPVEVEFTIFMTIEATIDTTIDK